MAAKECTENDYACAQVEILAKQSGPVNIETIKKRVKNDQADLPQSQPYSPEPENVSQERDCVLAEDDKKTFSKDDAVGRIQSEETSVSLPEPEFRNVAGHVKRRDDLTNDAGPSPNASGSRQTLTSKWLPNPFRRRRKGGKDVVGEGSGSESEGDGRNPSKNDDAVTTKRKQTPAEQEQQAIIRQSALQEQEKDETQRLKSLRELREFQRLSETTRQRREENRLALDWKLATLRSVCSHQDGNSSSSAIDVGLLRDKTFQEGAQLQEYFDDAIYGYIVDNIGADGQTRHSLFKFVIVQQIQENILRRYHRFDVQNESPHYRVRIDWLFRVMYEENPDTKTWERDGIVPEMELLTKSTDAVFRCIVREIESENRLERQSHFRFCKLFDEFRYSEDFFYGLALREEIEDYRRIAVLERVKTIRQFRNEITNVNIQQEFFEDFGAVSHVLSKNGSPSAIKHVADEELEIFGWHRDGPGQAYWRHALEGQMIYKITMDGEVLGAYTDAGVFVPLEYESYTASEAGEEEDDEDELEEDEDGPG